MYSPFSDEAFAHVRLLSEYTEEMEEEKRKAEAQRHKDAQRILTVEEILNM